MPDPITQKNRLISLKTPLGEDVLCIDQAMISEGVSQLFACQFDMIAELSKASSIKHDQIVGKGVTLTAELPGNKKRHFHGMVSRFSQTGKGERFVTYRAEVVPWLWLLGLTSDCKIFQDLKIPEIIEKVFKDWQGKFPDLVKFENKLQGSYTKVDYCVQYRETDLNFVSRLMEQEGIFYYFKPEDGKHTLVLGDSAAAFPACHNMEKARYLRESGMGEWQDGVSSYDFSHSMVPGKYVLGDYHFQLSNKVICPSENGQVKIGNNSSLEMYDFPGEFAQRFNKPDERVKGGEVESHAKEIVKWRMEEQRVAHLTITGNSTARAFTTGCYFSLLGKDSAQITIPGTSGKYVLTSVRHSIEQSPGYISDDTTDEHYQNSFTCVPQDVPYRPARTTPRPVIQGVQSAHVVGLKDEEIDCDKYGRVKVQFHWDREGKKDEDSSCWIRVGTPLAGKEWGMIHIPRIGQEVIVAFMEGDPDQPIIVGSVYNYENMPPYKLPDNKTQSGMKTRSTKEGDAETFNEFRFEDKKGEEQIYLHAEKNLEIVVENDEVHTVGHDKKDKGNQKLKVFNNQEIEIGTPQSSDGSQTLKVQKDRTATLEMGNDGLQIKMGNQTTKLDLGKSETEAMQSIEFKVGQSSITINQMGVTIKGMMVTVEGQILTDVKGTMTNVKGNAILTVGGGLMMLG